MTVHARHAAPQLVESHASHSVAWRYMETREETNAPQTGGSSRASILVHNFKRRKRGVCCSPHNQQLPPSVHSMLPHSQQQPQHAMFTWAGRKRRLLASSHPKPHRGSSLQGRQEDKLRSRPGPLCDVPSVLPGMDGLPLAPLLPLTKVLHSGGAGVHLQSARTRADMRERPKLC